MTCLSLDSGYLASTGEEGACRVWNIVELESLVRLEREKVCLAFLDIE